MYLTRKQRQVLDFLGQFIEFHGYSPSLEEIAEGLGLSALSTIHKHLKNLEAKGLLQRRWNHSRSLELTEEGRRAMTPRPEATAGAGVAELPLLGRIAAGSPIEAIEDRETLEVPESMLGRGPAYGLRVQGDSMIEDHIQDGDYVVVEQRRTASNGETVVALIRGEETTLKKFYREADRIRLQPANERLEPIYADPAELEIQGVVIAVLRKY
jgi:repressor LexA